MKKHIKLKTSIVYKFINVFNLEEQYSYNLTELSNH